MSNAATNWIKSSYSDSNGGQCVEWAPGVIAVAGEVPVRDSKQPEGPQIAVSTAAWSAFVDGLKANSI